MAMRLIFVSVFFLLIGCHGGGNRIEQPPKPKPFEPTVENGVIDVGGVVFNPATSADLSTTPFTLGEYDMVWYGTQVNGSAKMSIVESSWGDLSLVKISRSLAEMSYHFEVAKDADGNLRLLRATNVIVNTNQPYSFKAGPTVVPQMYWPKDIEVGTEWSGFLLDHLKYDFRVTSINAVTPQSTAQGKFGMTQIVANPKMGTYVSIWYFADEFGYFQQTSTDESMGEVASTPITQP